MRPHGLCGVVLSERWLELVATAAIVSTAQLPDGRAVRYGLRPGPGGASAEFAVVLADGDDAMPPLRRREEGRYVCELRPNRALRPPPAPNLGDLPPHDDTSCSLCSGPLRLALRPLVAQLRLASGRTWDVHYNISPIKLEGHYLLVPDISDAACRRHQLLTLGDCEVLRRRPTAQTFSLPNASPRSQSASSHGATARASSTARNCAWPWSQLHRPIIGPGASEIRNTDALRKP